MDTSRLNERLQILALLGVLAGLIFLALEIQQANRIAIATTEITVREGWGSVNETIFTNPETAALLAKARIADAEFSDAEREMLDAFAARMMNIWSGIEEAHANEMVSSVTFDKAIEDMKWHIDAYPGMRSLFEDYLEAYPSASESKLIRELVQYLEEK